MKKIISVLSCMLLVVCVFMFTACGSAYDGKYTEVDKNTATTFTQTVDTAVVGDNTLALNKGARMKMDINEEGMRIRSTIDAAIVDGKLLMKGNLSISMQGITINSDLYHDGNYLYIYTPILPAPNNKQKVALPMEAYIENQGGNADALDNQNLSSYVAQMGENVKCLIDDTSEEVKKLRFEIKEYGITTVVTFLFDAEYNLTGMQVKADNTTLEIELFEGTIVLPSDLNSYILNNGLL